MSVKKKVTKKVDLKPAGKSSTAKRAPRKNKFKEAHGEAKIALLEAQRRLQGHGNTKRQIEAQLNQVNLLIERETGAVMSLSNLVGKLNNLSQD